MILHAQLRTSISAQLQDLLVFLHVEIAPLILQLEKPAMTQILSLEMDAPIHAKLSQGMNALLLALLVTSFAQTLFST